MEDLRTRATKFMQIEEHIDYHQRFKAVGSGVLKDQTPSKEREIETERTVRTTPRSDRNKGGRIPKFNSYTPLTVPRGRALDEALQTDLIPTLKRYQTPPNADTAKHCQYHRNFAHTTERCQALKDKTEELIQAGHLRQFVKKTRNSRSPPRSTDRPVHLVVTTGHTVTITNAELTIARLRENAVKAPFGVHAPASQVPTETPALVNESAKSSI